MSSSALASVFYMISIAVCGTGFFCYRKMERTQHAITWLAITGIMLECFNAFIAGIFGLLNIPANLISIGILDLIVGVVLCYFAFAKGKKQSYVIEACDIFFAVLLVGTVLLIAQKRYGLLTLNWSYRTVDPSARYREAMEFVNNQSVSRMFFAQLQNGTLIELLSPWRAYDYYYQSYVLGDILQLILAGFMFFGMVRKWCKDRFSHILVPIVSMIYLLGYPLNSTLFGFTYLGMSLYLIGMLILLTDLFLDDAFEKRWFGIVLLSLGAHALFQCYVLFMPVTFLSMGLAFLVKQKKDGRLISLNTLGTGLAIFLPACVLGLIYTYMDVFVNDDTTVGSAFSAEGAIYRDLFSNFMFFLPMAILGAALMYRGLRTDHKCDAYVGQNTAKPVESLAAENEDQVRANRSNLTFCLFLPFFIAFTLGMFLISYKTAKISTYYFYKDYYLLWMLLFILLIYGFAHAQKQTRALGCFVLLAWAFIAGMYLTGLEKRIEAKNGLFVSSQKAPSYNDLLVFNWENLHAAPYSSDKMELMHYVYQELFETGETDKQVPVVAVQEDTYLYESVTGQRLEDYDFWKSDQQYWDYYANIDTAVDYVCVYTDNPQYESKKDYFEDMEKVFENEAGFVAKVH